MSELKDIIYYLEDILKKDERFKKNSDNKYKKNIKHLYIKSIINKPNLNNLSYQYPYIPPEKVYIIPPEKVCPIVQEKVCSIVQEKVCPIVQEKVCPPIPPPEKEYVKVNDIEFLESVNSSLIELKKQFAAIK